MMFELNETVVQKVLNTVRPGLSNGLGVQEPGHMCVEAAVCFALGLPHSDDPQCVNQALRNFKIILNDSMWSSNKARAKGLERLAIAQLGTLDTLDTKAFIDGLVVLAKKWADQANTVDADADAARAYAADTARAVARAVARAARAYAADTARAVARAAARAAYDAAAYAAHAARAARAARADAGDKVLSECAEDVVQLLIKLEAPGTKYLYLTEKM